MAAIDFGGPYYQSAIRAKEKQEKALGGQGLSPGQLAAITHGELTSRYASEQERKRTAMEQERLNMAKEEQESQEKAQQVAGVASLASTAAGIEMTTGAISGGAGAIAAGAGIAGEAAKDLFSGIGFAMAPLVLI